MKHGRKEYGFFKTEKKALGHIAKVKRAEKVYEGVDFNYMVGAVLQLAERPDLKSVKCEFESHQPHYEN